MVNLEPQKIAPPNYKGTVRCQNYSCQAEYKPGNWCLVSYEGTSSYSKFARSLPKNSCPICGQKEVHSV